MPASPAKPQAAGSSFSKKVFMSHRFINQLGERESINQVFLVADKQLRPNRSGNLYMCMQLADRTGSINAMMWNANDQVYRRFNNGDFVHVEGNTQVHAGALQIIVSRIDREDPNKVDEADFLQLAPNDVDQIAARLAEILRSIENHHLLNLAECFLMDDAFMEKFLRAPAGVKNHHAYRGGLIEHVVGLMEVMLLIAPRYPQIDRDLLLMGAFLHDMGKVDELSYERDMAYTDEGQLVGHVVMAVGILDEKVRRAGELSGEAIPGELILRLKHMIVSHHGQYEFGSPKLPMTLEAVALHHLDNLDAKVHSFQRLMEDDANVDSNWTTYFPNIGRKLFKGE